MIFLFLALFANAFAHQPYCPYEISEFQNYNSREMFVFQTLCAELALSLDSSGCRTGTVQNKLCEIRCNPLCNQETDFCLNYDLTEEQVAIYSSCLGIDSFFQRFLCIAGSVFQRILLNRSIK